MKTTRMISVNSRLYNVVLLLFSVFYLYSCEKDGNLINDPTNTFETPYYEMEFVVEEKDHVGFQIFAEEVFTNNTALLLSQVGLNADKLEEVILTEAEISFQEPDSSMNFDLLKYIELTVYTDDLGESKIAWLNPIPSDQKVLNLSLSEENVLPYFEENNFMLTSQGFLKNRISGNLQLLVKVKFQIKTRL